MSIALRLYGPTAFIVSLILLVSVCDVVSSSQLRSVKVLDQTDSKEE